MWLTLAPSPELNNIYSGPTETNWLKGGVRAKTTTAISELRLGQPLTIRLARRRRRMTMVDISLGHSREILNPYLLLRRLAVLFPHLSTTFLMTTGVPKVPLWASEKDRNWP